MSLRQTIGKLRPISRSVATAQIENHKTDVEFISSKAYETIPRIPTWKILLSIMDSKKMTKMDLLAANVD